MLETIQLFANKTISVRKQYMRLFNYMQTNEPWLVLKWCYLQTVYLQIYNQDLGLNNLIRVDMLKYWQYLALNNYWGYLMTQFLKSRDNHWQFTNPAKRLESELLRRVDLETDAKAWRLKQPFERVAIETAIPKSGNKNSHSASRGSFLKSIVLESI